MFAQECKPLFHLPLQIVVQQGLLVQFLLIKMEALNLMMGQIVTGIQATLMIKSLLPTMPRTHPSSLFSVTHPSPISLHPRIMQVVDMHWMRTINGSICPLQRRWD
jgi:hypothetical protein